MSKVGDRSLFPFHSLFHSTLFSIRTRLLASLSLLDSDLDSRSSKIAFRAGMQHSVQSVISAATAFCEISTFLCHPISSDPSAAVAKAVSLRIFFSAQFAAVSDNV